MSYPQEIFTRTTLTPGFLISKRREAVQQHTLLYQLDVLKKTGRYDAFKLQWHPSYSDASDVWPIPNHLFWDSDVAKWIEGACYFLHETRLPEVDSAIHELVSMINTAQQPDGYLNIHYTVVEPGKRFTNLRDMHELYNAGHLIEAALAHHGLYKNEDLLRPILKYVDLLCQTFGQEETQIHGYPGHPEIELALLRLYQRTGKTKILALAEYFIRERGSTKNCSGEHFYVAEAEKRGEDANKRPSYWPSTDCLWYYQAHKPIVEQETIEGHSVRAMYLLTAASDLVLTQKDHDSSVLRGAIQRLWRNMVDKKMYITGGIGAMKQWEGFGIDYFLPQGTDEGGCYSETCAAIGVMMLAERLLQIELNREYSDIMELCLYNSVLTAMSSDGKAFTYVNQLASSEQDLSQRESWFTCACCPPNIMRVLGQIGGYATSHNIRKDGTTDINVHLFMSSLARVPAAEGTVEVSQVTNWPWSGDIKFEVRGSIENVRLNIRIPSWADSYSIKPACSETVSTRGYLSLSSTWLAQHSSFTLSIPIKPRMISPHPSTNQNTVSIARGPIIYCVEDIDNPWVNDHFKTLYLDADVVPEESVITENSTGDEFVRLTMKKAARLLPLNKVDVGPYCSPDSLNKLLSSNEPVEALHFVPYYLRANRGGKGHMRVGLKRWTKAGCSRRG